MFPAVASVYRFKLKEIGLFPVYIVLLWIYGILRKLKPSTIVFNKVLFYYFNLIPYCSKFKNQMEITYQLLNSFLFVTKRRQTHCH